MNSTITQNIEILKNLILDIIQNPAIYGVSLNDLNSLKNIVQDDFLNRIELSAEKLNSLFSILDKYSNKIKNYTQIKTSINQNFKKPTQQNEPIITSQNSNNEIIIDYNYISPKNMFRFMIKKSLSRTETDFIKSEIQKTPEIKNISDAILRENATSNNIMVKLEYLNIIKEIFKKLNYSFIEYKIKITINGVINTTEWGEKLLFSFNVNNKNLLQEIKSNIKKEKLWGVTIGQNPGRKNSYLLSIDPHQKTWIRRTIELLNRFLDTEELSIKVEPYISITHTENQSNCLDFEDVPHTNHIRVKIVKPITENEFQHIKETVTYNFPENHKYNKTKKSFTVGGAYQQFVYLGRTLKEHNYNVDKLRSILSEKVKNGDLKKELINGDGHDSFYAILEKSTNIQIKKTNTIEEAKEFYLGLPDREKYEIYYVPKLSEKLDEILARKDKNIELYHEQKEGVEFLFYRKCAILGDETGLGKCNYKDNLIQTNKGLYTIEELWNKFSKNIIINEKEEWADVSENLYVHSMNEDEKIIQKKITKLYREKINAPMKEIITSNGKKTITTIPHKFYTLEGWKSSLTTNDYICSSSNQFSFGNNEFNDLNLTKLLAWQISEGCEGKNRVSITQKEKHILENLKEIYDNMNYKNEITQEISKAVIKKSKRKLIYSLEINSTNYIKHIKSLGYEFGNKSSTKKIPEFIMQSNEKVIKTFLKSYFDAEGYVNPNCRQIEITSASYILIYQLSLLLQRFNILCSFAEKLKIATNGNRIKRKYYCLYICGTGVNKFFKEISLDYKLKNLLRIKTKQNTNKEGKPIHLYLNPFFNKYKIPYKFFDIPNSNYIKGKRFATNKMIEKIIKGFENFKSDSVIEGYKKIPKSKWTNKTLNTLNSINKNEIQEIINKLKKLKNNDLQYEKIKSIKQINYEGYVYDISVENTHNYIANNLISHNTIQLISAAEAKMQDNNYQGSTLILAINDLTAAQWAEEITKIIGRENKDLISTNFKDLKRWTVLTYNFFSYNTNDIKDVIKNIQRYNFEIVILDELHKIKNEKTARSQKLAAALKNIPIKWGATATISANKPMDVRNQLIILGHSLGRMPAQKFKKEFCGMKFKEGKWVEGEEDDKLEAAERLNKWLHLTGVYIRRNKSDVRNDMPNLELNRDDVPIDVKTYEEKTSNRLKLYYRRALEKGTDPDKAMHLKIMIANRTELAIAKVNQTVQKAETLLKQNKRIIIFTAFKEAAERLKPKLERLIHSIDPNYKLLTYINSTATTERSNVKYNFNNNNIYRILLMSLKMGSTGIDFPNAATEMIINDYDWTPEQAEQSEGRIYRINTNHDVNVYYIIAHGTYDEQLYEKLQLKRRIAERIQRTREEYRKEKNISDSKSKLVELVKLKKELAEIDKQMNKIVSAEEERTLKNLEDT